MERRKFMIGAGALVTGSSAAVGTGAFTTASTGARTVDVDVADDSGAFLALEPSEGPNGIYADETDGTLELNFNEDTGGTFSGEGVNEGSEYTFDNVFQIRNDQSTFEPIGNEVDLWVTTEDLSGVQFYAGGDPDDRLEAALWETGGDKTNFNPGMQGLEVGVKIIEEKLDGDGITGDVTIHAEESPASIRD